MAKVIINRFDGGLAQSERPESGNEALDMQGFDVFSDAYKLKRAARPTTSETDGATYDLFINDAVKRESDGLIVGVGQTSSSTTAGKFYSRNTSMTTNWTKNTQNFSNVATPGNTYVNLYKEGFYATVGAASATTVYKYTNDSSITTIGSVSDFNKITPKPIVHSQDNILYVAGGKTIGKYDGTTWTAAAITLPYVVTSLCEFGTYVAIACQAPFGGVIYLWGRDTSLTTLQDIIKVDSGKLMIIENIDGVLTSVSEIGFEVNSSAGAAITFNTRTLVVRQYTGQTMQKVKSATYSTTNESGSGQSLSNKKMLIDGTLYFSTNSNYLWRFGKHKQTQQSILARDMRCSGSVSANVTETLGFFVLGDYITTCNNYGTAVAGGSSQGVSYTFAGSSDLVTGRDQTETAYYTTTVNPSMLPEDRGKDKRLTLLGIRGWANSGGTGSVTLEYSIDNGANYTTAISASGLFSTAGPGKVWKFFTTSNNNNTELAVGVEYIFKISTTRYVDVVELIYDYEVVDQLMNN